MLVGKQERHVTRHAGKDRLFEGGFVKLNGKEQDNPGGCHRSLLLRSLWKFATSRHVANACSQITR